MCAVSCVQYLEVITHAAVGLRALSLCDTKNIQFNFLVQCTKIEKNLHVFKCI